MRNDLTDITFIVDHSGSMNARRYDADGGINAFIADQKKAEGDAIFTLVQFDAEYEFVHKGVKIEDVPPYTLWPRGMTALLDAVGRAVVETGVRLNDMPESERPGNVVIVIVTDGRENASHEFNRVQVRDMITHQQEKYNWHFTYLGANASTFADSASIGISKGATLQYDPNRKVQDVFATMSASVSGSRCASASGLDASVAYTESDRKNVL